MKIHRLASTRPQGWFFINWWLMNHCSWTCSYCPDIIRKGNIDLPFVDDCKNFLDRAQLHGQQRGLKLHLDFTGGEVTEWNQFLELIGYAKSIGSLVQFRSNASCALAHWQKLMNSTDIVVMEVHPEHTSLGHFLICVESAKAHEVEVHINVNMLPNNWQEIESVLEKIQTKWPEISISRKILFDDPIKNTQPKNYSQPQMDLLKNQRHDLIYTTGNVSRSTDYQTLILENKNRFTGWRCQIGLDQVIVDAWGKIYKGHCRKSAYIGKISDDQINWPTEPMICDLPLCRNAFDIQAGKQSC